MGHQVHVKELSVGGLLESRREGILRHLEHRLRGTGSLLGKDPAVLPACIARADAILTATARDLGQPSARPEPDPADDAPPGGASVLMDVVLRELLQLVADQPDMLPQLPAAVTALHRNLASQVPQSGDSYDSFILRTADEARRGERRQLAREIHDELGHELSIAMHQLELAELYGAGNLEAAEDRVGSARERLASAIQIVRRLIAEFATAPPVDLEKEIVSFADAAGWRTPVHVRVTGDQLRVPSAHRHELFLIVREALLNVFAHARATKAVVLVDITEDAVAAVVEDDGTGFDPARPRRGFGLVSMRERAGSVHGTATVSSSRSGTRVDVRLPLP